MVHHEQRVLQIVHHGCRVLQILPIVLEGITNSVTYVESIADFATLYWKVLQIV